MEAVKETVEAVKETVENVSEIVEAEVEAVKADPLYKRIMAALSSFCSVVVARLSAILAPVLNLVSAITDRLATVPWTSLLLLLTTQQSQLTPASPHWEKFAKCHIDYQSRQPIQTQQHTEHQLSRLNHSRAEGSAVSL